MWRVEEKEEEEKTVERRDNVGKINPQWEEMKNSKEKSNENEVSQREQKRYLVLKN